MPSAPATHAQPRASTDTREGAHAAAAPTDLQCHLRYVGSLVKGRSAGVQHRLRVQQRLVPCGALKEPHKVHVADGARASRVEALLQQAPVLASQGVHWL
jgi:hypothetical protein